MLICTKCGNKYNEKFIRSLSNGKSYCPKLGCSEVLIDVDTNLVEIIINLNKKGWVTKFCYSSKPIEDEDFDIHIIFDKISVEDYKNKSTPFANLTPPRFFDLVFEKMRFTKDKEYDSQFVFPKLISKHSANTLQEKFSLITECSLSLYEWSKNIQEYNKEN